MSSRNQPDPRIDAQAAAWLARLQTRNEPVTELAFAAWLQENERHRAAFERARAVWDSIPEAAMLEEEDEVLVRKTPRLVAAALAIAASIILAVAIGFFSRDTSQIYETGVGERARIVLIDGSRIDLNTNSKVSVQYGDGFRRVRLDRGEAMFDVAKDRQHPFLVASRDKEVRALGTSFLVRRYARMTVVTLAEGKVEIARNDRGRRVRLALLRSGDRATMIDDAETVLDRPSIEIATAWRNGEVMFEDASLLDAVQELNRYATSSSIVLDPSIAGLRISGIFRTGQLREFALAAKTLHGLRLEQNGSTLLLLPGSSIRSVQDKKIS